MHMEDIRDMQKASRDPEDSEILESQQKAQKKPFKKPELVQHDGLPQVTTGFFGSFP